MLTLEATQTLRGVAETADVVTVSAFGDESGSETDNDFKVLYQGQLAAATSILYTTPALHATLIRSIHVRNTHPTLSKWVEFFVGGLGNENSVARFVVPMNGSAIYDGRWTVYDESGQVSFVGAPGANGAAGSVWHEGTGTPLVGTGANGDYYLNDANGDVYKKESGTWGIVANILGPQGDTGPAGSTADITTHEGAADPHTGYQKESEKNIANGYAGLDANVRVATARLGSGTAGATTFLRGDQSWAVPTGAYVGVKATISAAQSLTSGNATDLLFDVEVWDTNGFHDATNTDRFTIPSGQGGRYSIMATVQFATSATSRRGVGISKNATNTMDFPQMQVQASGNGVTAVHIATVMDLIVGDIIRIPAIQLSGGALNVSNAEIIIQKVG